jgi:hypothetical protein
MKEMNRKTVFFITTILLSTLIVPAYAKNPNQIMLSNPDYVLNILAKDHFTGNPMQNSPDRHTIFVPLHGGSQIFITQAPRGSDEKFQVLDANAFDDGHANLTLGDGYYAVWIAALGKPNGKLDLNASVSSLDVMIQLQTIHVERSKKGPNWMDESKLFYITNNTIYDFFLQYYTALQVAGDLTITDPVINATQAYNELWSVFLYNDLVWEPGEIYGIDDPAVWIFDFFDYLADEGTFNYGGSSYWWDLKNNGLRHLQVRFYKLRKRSAEVVWVLPEA